MKRREFLRGMGGAAGGVLLAQASSPPSAAPSPAPQFGTQNDALIYGVEAAADFVAAIGLPAIWEHNRRLTEACVNAVRVVPGLEVLSPAEPAARSAMVTFHFPGRNNREISSLLVQRRLRPRSVTEGALDAVRVSFHVYNDASEVERLVTELKTIARR
jgi:cysteine desulfurase/selenocysteine lyase